MEAPSETEPETSCDGAPPRPVRNRGATAVEYALIVALIAAIIFAAVVALGDKTLNNFQNVENEMNDHSI